MPRLGDFAAAIGAAAASAAATAGPSPIVLSDQSAAVHLAAVHAPDTKAIPLGHRWMSSGMAVGDFNNDGAPDLFWVAGGNAPDKLFINDGTGAFTDEAAAWGVNQVHCGAAASAGDFDGDGYLDIYVSSFGTAGHVGPGMNRLYRNNGGASFTDVAAAAGVNFTSLTAASAFGSAFGDYDLDGDLDLFVTSYMTQGGASNGNRLYRNNGDGSFTDVTGASGLAATLGDVHSYQPAFVDMNGDLYPELLISADFGTSRYYVNDGDGTFTDYTALSGTGLDDNGMGQAVADLDNNGFLDWYVTSVHYETEYSPNTPGTGNMLYVGLAPHFFLEQSIARGVNDGGWGWGAIAVDLDHDGWQELLEVNGWPGGSPFMGECGKLFWNLGSAVFADTAVDDGFATFEDGRSLVYLDADRDGDMDVAVSNHAGPLQYYRNDSASGSWLHISLDTANNDRLAPNGYGTKVTATVAGQSRIRYLNASPSYLATSEPAVHFGLGAATTVDELRMEWARGQVTVLTDVPVNQHLTITSPKLGDIDADGVIGIADFLFVLAHWGPVTGRDAMPADLDADGLIGINDFLFILGNWG